MVFCYAGKRSNNTNYIEKKSIFKEEIREMVLIYTGHFNIELSQRETVTRKRGVLLCA